MKIIFIKKNNSYKDNIDTSDFSNINKLTDYSATQNFMEKTKNSDSISKCPKRIR